MRQLARVCVRPRARLSVISGGRSEASSARSTERGVRHYSLAPRGWVMRLMMDLDDLDILGSGIAWHATRGIWGQRVSTRCGSRIEFGRIPTAPHRSIHSTGVGISYGDAATILEFLPGDTLLQFTILCRNPTPASGILYCIRLLAAGAWLPTEGSADGL
jgi:hypothetical protein